MFDTALRVDDDDQFGRGRGAQKEGDESQNGSKQAVRENWFGHVVKK
ncbi:MAG: hypothetical protein ACD_10C00694G0002 [uncultured bacterium]|nr:MAG: hypothetical protein ACD_10C00694G0002 [uncultured bacterium]